MSRTSEAWQPDTGATLRLKVKDSNQVSQSTHNGIRLAIAALSRGRACRRGSEWIFAPRIRAAVILAKEKLSNAIKETSPRSTETTTKNSENKKPNPQMNNRIRAVQLGMPRKRRSRRTEIALGRVEMREIGKAATIIVITKVWEEILHIRVTIRCVECGLMIEFQRSDDVIGPSRESLESKARRTGCGILQASSFSSRTYKSTRSILRARTRTETTKSNYESQSTRCEYPVECDGLFAPVIASR